MTQRTAVDVVPPPAGLSVYAEAESPLSGHRDRLAGFRGSIPVAWGGGHQVVSSEVAPLN